MQNENNIRIRRSCINANEKPNHQSSNTVNVSNYRQPCSHEEYGYRLLDYKKH